MTAGEVNRGDTPYQQCSTLGPHDPHHWSAWNDPNRAGTPTRKGRGGKLLPRWAWPHPANWSRVYCPGVVDTSTPSQSLNSEVIR